MEFEQILKLIDHVSASHLESFCYESDGLKLTLNNKIAPVIVAGMPGQTVAAAANEMAYDNNAASSKTENKAENKAETKTEIKTESITEAKEKAAGNIVKSPLVGTFYAAPSEDAQPFVKVGDKVTKGQILAIVEAMKLMNDIESDFDGEITEIYVENGQPVEYGQPLFSIK